MSPFDFHEGITWASVMRNMGILGGIYYFADKIKAAVDQYRFRRMMRALEKAGPSGPTPGHRHGGWGHRHADAPPGVPPPMLASGITRHRLVCADCGERIEYAVIDPLPGESNVKSFMHENGVRCTLKGPSAQEGVQ